MINRDYKQAVSTGPGEVHLIPGRNDEHSCVRHFRKYLPQLDELEEEIVCIPIGWWVSETDAMNIVNLIKQWCKQHAFAIKTCDISHGEKYLNLLYYLNNYHIEYSKKEWIKS